MLEFRPIFAPFFSRQRKLLLSSKKFESLRMSPLVETQLNSLEPDLGSPSLTASIWHSSLQAAKPLIVRTIILCSCSAVLMLCSVMIVRSLISFDLPFYLMALLCILVFCLESLDHIIKYYDMIRRADIARVIQLHLIGRLHSKILRLESSVIGNLDKGNLKTLVSSDVEAVEDFITAASANWIPTLTLITIMTPYLYYSLGVVGLVGIFVTLIQIPASMVFAFISEKLQEKAQTQQDALASLVGEWVRHIRLVRVLGWQDWVANKIYRIVRIYTTQTALKHAINCITYGISFGWWLLVAFSMLLANRWLGLPLSIIDFFSSLWALGYLSNYVQYVPFAISLYGSAAAGSKRLKVFLDIPESSLRYSSNSEINNLILKEDSINGVIFENLSVGFDGKVVLDNLNFKLDLNQKTGIIGEVASGKSILLEVMLGERFPDSGKVYVTFESGEMRNLWDKNTYIKLRELIAYCPAEPYISNASLKENIDIWSSSPKEVLDTVIESTLLAKDIALFEKGLDEEIGEMGINLSGGQKQRTSLARAILSKREVFVLDDPLSAVDVATERVLFNDLIRRAKGLVLVSHRLSELSQLDRLIVMEGGQIIEDGDPSILKSNPNSTFVRYINAHEDRGAA